MEGGRWTPAIPMPSSVGRNGTPEALAVARLFHPDTALLDIGLPVMDGYEVARKLREEERSDLFIVAITGYGRDPDRERARR